jgi:hypothetical protein
MSVVPVALTPRIGGIIESTGWTRGSNLTADCLDRLESFNAYCPTGFKSGKTVEETATKGLEEGKRLGPFEDSSPKSLTSWINSLRVYLIECGLDTVFCVYHALTNTEINILIDWGSISADDVLAWVTELQTGVSHTDGTTLPVCSYDLDNLKWSGRAVLNSITVALWDTLETQIGVDATGPEAYIAIINHLQQVSSGAIRLLVKELKELCLIDEPGQDVGEFIKKIVMKCRTILCTGSPPDDLRVIIAARFLGSDVFEFSLVASSLHNEIEMATRDGSRDWEYVCKTLSAKFVSLLGQKLWPPLQGKASVEDPLAALHAQVNKLTVQMNGPLGSKGGTETRTCFKCGAVGHLANACLQEDPPTGGRQGSGGRGGSCNTAPKLGEPTTKTVDGVKWCFCATCRLLTKGPKAHLTEQHVTRSTPTPPSSE